MGFTAKNLADGQLASTKGDLLTATSETLYIKFFSCVNAGSTTETVIVYYKKSGGTSRIIGRAVLGAGDQARFIDKDETIILENGDKLEGVTTTATTVDYVIAGISEV